MTGKEGLRQKRSLPRVVLAIVTLLAALTLASQALLGGADASASTSAWEEDVYCGGISVQKADADLAQAYAQGDATLAGATFSITNASDNPVVVDGTTYAKGEVVWTLVTDASGYAATGSTALPYGTYEVVETKAPEGYLADPQTYTVQVREQGVTYAAGCEATPAYGIPATSLDGFVVPDGAVTIVGDSVIRGGVSVQKVDQDTQEAVPQGDASLAGITFSITNASDHAVLVDGVTYAKDEVVWTLVTDASGYAATAADLLPYGTYEVAEVSQNGSYQAGEHGYTQTVQIREQGVVVACGADFANPVVRGGISVQKADADLAQAYAQGDATLAGATFSITNASDNPVVVGGVTYAKGEVVMTITTDAKGYASTGSTALPYGTYEVRETKAPDGYRADPQTYTVVVRVQGLTYAAGYEAAPAYDVTSTAAAAGTEDLYAAMSERMGLVKVPALEEGLLTIIGDNVVAGGIELYKVDSETGERTPQGDASLAGAQFTITNASAHAVLVDGVVYQSGEVIMTLTTDAKGYAATGRYDLPYGTYVVAEVTPPEGYLSSSTSQTVRVRESGRLATCTYSFKDKVATGGFGVRKYDSETVAAQAQGDASLAGATFSITNKSANPVVVKGVTYRPGEVVMTITTDASGWAQTGAHDLPYGTYVIKETKAPEGYRLGTADEDGTLTGEHVSFTVTIDSDGYWKSFTLAGLGLDEGADAQQAAETDLVMDQVVRGGIKLYKADAETADGSAQGDATLAGATFSITNASDNPVVVGGVTYAKGEVVMTITTDASGYAATGPRDLPYGTYEIREIAAPEGYFVSDATQTVSVRSERRYARCEVSFEDQVVRGGVSVQKADAETAEASAQGGASLAGAEFTIYSASDHLVCVRGQSYAKTEAVIVIRTNDKGYASTASDDLPYGTYVIKETKAPSGYLLSDEEVTFTIREDGVVVRVATGS